MTTMEESATPSTPELPESDGVQNNCARGRASAAGGERPVQAWTAKRAALITTGANLLMSVLGVFTGVVAARLLGPKGRGELAAIQAWPSALAVLALLGTSEAVLYFCAREPRRRAEYLGAALLIGTVGALVFSLAGFFAMPWLLASQSPAIVWGARVFLFQIWLYLLISMPAEVLRAGGHFVAWNILRICPMLVWVGIFVVAWLTGVRRAVPLASAYIAVGWLLLGPAIVLLRRNGFSLARPRRIEVAETLKFGLPAVSTFMPRMLNLRLDQILMAGLLPPAALGQYVVAVAWSGAGTPLIHGLSSVIVPKLAGRSGEGAAGSELLARAARLGTLVAALLAFALMVLAPMGIPFFFGLRFGESIRAAKILAIAGGVAGLNMVLSEGIRGMGRPASVLRAELAALVVTAGGLWLLLRPLGIYGAALVSLIAYAVTTCWLLFEARMVTGFAIADFLLPRVEDFHFITGAVREFAQIGLCAADSVPKVLARALRRGNS